jgi:hypothetical protein
LRGGINATKVSEKENKVVKISNSFCEMYFQYYNFRYEKLFIAKGFKNGFKNLIFNKLTLVVLCEKEKLTLLKSIDKFVLRKNFNRLLLVSFCDWQFQYFNFCQE